MDDIIIFTIICFVVCYLYWDSVETPNTNSFRNKKEREKKTER